MLASPPVPTLIFPRENLVSAQAKFRAASRLGLATTLLMFGLMVVGSIVRTTGSGLACPDWPLCQGRLIPPFEFHVLIEWFHRLVALLVSLLVFSTVAWVLANAPLRARLGGLAALAVALLAAQVMLGALTVWKLLDPAIVAGHLGVALLLFCTLLTLTLVAQAQAEPEDLRPARPAGLLPVVGLTSLAAYAQCLLGGIVAANNAGLACPDWPTCNGEWFPLLQGPAGLQMLHRYAAYGLTALIVFTAMRARLAPDAGVRAGVAMALGLIVAQVVLGVSSVYLGTPPWLVAAHLATAATIVAMMVAVTFRVAMMPVAETGLAHAEAR